MTSARRSSSLGSRSPFAVGSSHRLLAACLTVALGSPALAQSSGFRLISPRTADACYLVDDQGALVHTWNVAAGSQHMLDDGSLLLSTTGAVAGGRGSLQRLAFDGTLLWDMPVNDPTRSIHHDIEPMPNGNVLIIVWDELSTNDAIAAGRDPALTSGTDWRPDAILEIQPTGATTGNIVWQWHFMDHVIQDFDPSQSNYGPVGSHPELLDLNFPHQVAAGGDWNHSNGIDYDPANDWIILSSREQNEIYLIDHSTTTAEAAGHTGGLRGKGGDILYRWGNPLAYRAGLAADQQLFGQHDSRFIRPGCPGAGNLTVFNNGYLPNQSAVHELALPLDPSGNIVLDPVTGRYGPAAPLWTYTDPAFYSPFVSSAQRLANGRTLICSGQQKRIFEVTLAGQVAFSYTHSTHGILFQAHSIDRSLWTDTSTLPLAGGTIGFEHRVDSSLAGHYCFLLGSMTGTSPGTPIPGGVLLPLNADFLTSAMAAQWNTGMFMDTLGYVGSLGEASSSIVVPPGVVPAALVGVDLDFAHLIYDPSLLAVRASDPTPITIVP